MRFRNVCGASQLRDTSSRHMRLSGASAPCKSHKESVVRISEVPTGLHTFCRRHRNANPSTRFLRPTAGHFRDHPSLPAPVLQCRNERRSPKALLAAQTVPDPDNYSDAAGACADSDWSDSHNRAPDHSVAKGNARAMTTTPERRWLRFSLRTLLVVTVLAALAIVWSIKAFHYAREAEYLEPYFRRTETSTAPQTG